MREQKATGQAGQVAAPPLDKRVERFVQRYIDSPLKLEIIRTLAARPNRFYPLPELAAFAEGDEPDVERAVGKLGQMGIVSTKNERGETHVGLSRSPVVRETAVLIFRYCSRPGGHAALGGMARRRR